MYFLHDGRANDLVTAIREHAGTTGKCTTARAGCASEANLVVRRFGQLSAAEEQDLLNFLRSL
jgi:CxxC motif-containing protein (DUF1111 family)